MSHQIARNFFGWSWGWFVVRGDQMAQSIEWDRANRGPVSWQGRVGHDKDPSNLRGRQVEHRLEFCSPSLAAHYTDVPIRVKYSPTGQKAIINQSIFILPDHLCGPFAAGSSLGGVIVTTCMEVLVRVLPISFLHVTEICTNHLIN